MGVTPMGGTPDEVRTYIASESARWAEVVKTAGIRMD
jgi:tripartite-type tricarboxylate transporter receptor subunit TctC